MSRYIRFSSNYDTAILKTELTSCLDNKWIAHFNQKDYSGEWNCIALRSKSGNSSDILTFGESDFIDTELLNELPYTKQIIDSIPGKKETIRYMALYPNSHIHPHKDIGCSYEEGLYRIHIPIVTNDEVLFYLENELIKLKEGECWYLDFSKTHEIINTSKHVRVHLVIDGIRDNETDEWFIANGFQFSENKMYDDLTLNQMIEELKRMNTPTSLALIENLKAQQNV